MIVDINAWTGHWGSLPPDGQVEAVGAALRRIGVARICLAPLHAVWCHNPHHANDLVYEAARRAEDIDPVPLLDPTIATWRQELERARLQPRLHLVKLAPTYGAYELEVADELFEALAAAGLAAIVQVRLEDPRRQHPLAQVPDLPPESVVEAARRHPGLPLIIGGAATRGLVAVSAALRDLKNLYADVSQVDGLDSIGVLVEKGLGKKLLFGSHAPIFIPLAGLSRVVADLQGEVAEDILCNNARRMLAGRIGAD